MWDVITCPCPLIPDLSRPESSYFHTLVKAQIKILHQVYICDMFREHMLRGGNIGCTWLTGISKRTCDLLAFVTAFISLYMFHDIPLRRPVMFHEIRRLLKFRVIILYKTFELNEDEAGPHIPRWLMANRVANITHSIPLLPDISSIDIKCKSRISNCIQMISVVSYGASFVIFVRIVTAKTALHSIQININAGQPDCYWSW